MSIKKKFATAVATASLLAGLFGSAFVPSAMGAVILPVGTVVAKYTTLTEGALVKQAGSAKVFGFQTADSDDGAVAANAYIDIALFTAGAAGAGTTKLDLTDAVNAAAVLKATSSNGNVNVGWGYDNDTTDVLPADSDDTGDDTAGDGSVDAVACTGDITVGTTSSVTNVTGSNNLGGNSFPAGDALNGVHSGVFRLCLASETETTAATSTITITWNGAVVATFTVTAIGPMTSITASLTQGYKYLAEGNSYLDEWLTIIARDAAGVQINGADTSISNEQLYFDDADTNPDNQQGDFMGFFTGSGGNGSMDGDTIGSGTADIGYDVEYDVCAEESGAGEDDGDAGNSYTLKVQDDGAGVLSGDVYSNGITITCTLGGVGARLTTATVEATSGADEYEDDDMQESQTHTNNQDQISIFATIVDANGAPLGDGANLGDDDLNFDLEFSGDASLCVPNHNYNNEHSCIKYGRDATSGLFLMAAIKPDTSRFGRFTYTITAGDSDYNVSQVDGDDPVAKTYTFTYTAINQADPVTITKVRNAAKTTAVFTADMGESSAFEIVYFTVEKANGTVVEYGRRANGVGVAKLTLSRRNTTIYVYASEMDDTDVVKCVFR